MAFHSLEFWDQRYQQHRELFDWYMELPEFQRHVLDYVREDSEILILGGGTSRLCLQLYDLGYKNITVIDYCRYAKDAIERYLDLRPEIQYLIQDVATFRVNSTFDLIIDKGLLDCVLSNPSDPLEQLKQCVFSVVSVMGPQSVWVSISFDIDREMHLADASDALCVREEVEQVHLLVADETATFYVYHIRLK